MEHNDETVKEVMALLDKRRQRLASKMIKLIPIEWLGVFQKVNQDCSRDGEMIVPFTDVEHYAEQIHNLTGEVDEHYALSTAIAIRDL